MSSFASSFSTLAFVFLVAQLTKNINFSDSNNIFYARTAYVIGQSLILALSLYIRRRILKSNEKGIIKVTESPKPFSTETTPVEQSMTTCEYDLNELSKSIKQTLTSILIIGFLHFKFGYVQPLILQTLIPLKTLFGTPLFQIYILGKSAQLGTLKRPWKAPNPFGDLMAQQQQNVESERKKITASGNSRKED